MTVRSFERSAAVTQRRGYGLLSPCDFSGEGPKQRRQLRSAPSARGQLLDSAHHTP